jgi:hypothetical protein
MLSALSWESLGLSFRPFRYILRHKKVPHGDAPIEIAEVGGAGEFGQLVVPDRFFPVMIGLALRLAQWLPHNPLPNRIRTSIARTDSGGRMLHNCSYPPLPAAYWEFSPLSSGGIWCRAVGRAGMGRKTRLLCYLLPAAGGFADLRNRRAVAKATR